MDDSRWIDIIVDADRLSWQKTNPMLDSKAILYQSKQPEQKQVAKLNLKYRK